MGDRGGSIGPDLSTAGACIPPAELVESLLWPARKVKEGYETVRVATADGRVVQGYRQAESADAVTIRDPASSDPIRIAEGHRRRAAGRDADA